MRNYGGVNNCKQCYFEMHILSNIDQTRYMRIKGLVYKNYVAQFCFFNGKLVAIYIPILLSIRDILGVWVVLSSSIAWGDSNNDRAAKIDQLRLERVWIILWYVSKID